MDLPDDSSLSPLQAVKERMREKLNGTLKVAKLQTSLASKIKSKNFNNSSAVKISLKHNNRALACALTAEKEKSRRLESDKMILQKEVKMVHFQNAVLRQNLSIVNTMLKDIDALMNINLPTLIELSSIGESSDVLAEERKSERYSRKSRLSVDGLQGFRLTGVALRVPSSVTEQQQCSNDSGDLQDEDEHLINDSPDSNTAKEIFDGQHDIEMPASPLTGKDNMTPSIENVTYDCSLNMKVNSVLPSDEDLLSYGKSYGFVTRRRKRSTASRSSTQSANSDCNRSKNSLGVGRESSCSSQWGMNSPANLSPEPGHSGVTGDKALPLDFVSRKLSSSPLSKSGNFNAMNNSKDTTLHMETTLQAHLAGSGECDMYPIVERPVEQEKTVYEADMEMTSSDSASIVAVMPKRKTKTSKSGIPVKKDGASLRKVKTTAHDKTKKNSSCKGEESTQLSRDKEKVEVVLNKEKESPSSVSGEKMEVPSNADGKVSFDFKPLADFRLDSADLYNCRRTYVVPGPVIQDKNKIFEVETIPCPSENQAKSSVVCSVEESFVVNDENIPLEIQSPGDFTKYSADQYDNRRTYVLPGPVIKDKFSESETIQCLSKNQAKSSVVCSVEESFVENDENIPLEIQSPGDFTKDSADQYINRRTYVLPGPVNKAKGFEGKSKLHVGKNEVKTVFSIQETFTETIPCPSKNKAKSSVVCSVEGSFVENDENIPLEIQSPGDFMKDSADQYNNRRTYVLPDPVNKAKGFEGKTKLHAGKNEVKPVFSIQETFTDGSSGFAVKNLPSSDVEENAHETVVKKRKSKLGKRTAKDMENSKKKRKVTTNVGEGESKDRHRSNELDNTKLTDSDAASVHIKALEPCIRRETYVLSSAKPNCEFIPKNNEINWRRETFVIPQPNRPVCFSEKIVENPDDPLHSIKSALSEDLPLNTENVIDAETAEPNLNGYAADTDFKKPVGAIKSKCKEPKQNKNFLNLFSQIDKRKTHILATNNTDVNKDALVRESCVNAKPFNSGKPTNFLNAVLENEQDSFMLDMVSESILDGTMDGPSFVEFPSANHLDAASMCNVSLNNTPLLDPPVSEERSDTIENEQLNSSNRLDVLKENGLAQETFEVENDVQCKVENQSIEIEEADGKPLQDMTNKTHEITKQSPKSSSEDQEEGTVHTRRRRNPVNYKEPSLGKKLRRGDSSTDTEFMSASGSKGKGKKGASKKKNVKSEECPTKNV